MYDERSNGIAALNDRLRRTGAGGHWFATVGIRTLGPETLAAVIGAIRSFAAFDKDNDPYGEHDCAIVEAAGQRALFKIDYYDLTLSSHSPDPADPGRTVRVMTVMLASEY